jgi:hypothetical protein
VGGELHVVGGQNKIKNTPIISPMKKIINPEEFVEVKKERKCHAELGSASNKINLLRDPETSSG